MTLLKKRAIWGLLIWGIVSTAIIIIFFSKGGAATFLQGETRVTLTRAFWTGGMICYFLMMILTRTRSGAKSLIKDERDELIEKRAYLTGFAISLTYNFLFCMFLYWFYKVYQNSKLMPTGWVWFLGLSSVSIVLVSHSIATYILDARMGGHGES